MLQVNNENNRTTPLKLLIVNFEHISHIFQCLTEMLHKVLLKTNSK